MRQGFLRFEDRFDDLLFDDLLFDDLLFADQFEDEFPASDLRVTLVI